MLIRKTLLIMVFERMQFILSLYCLEMLYMMMRMGEMGQVIWI